MLHNIVFNVLSGNKNCCYKIVVVIKSSENDYESILFMTVFCICRNIFTERLNYALIYEVMWEKKAFEFKLLIYKVVARYLSFTISLLENKFH